MSSLIEFLMINRELSCGSPHFSQVDMHFIVTTLPGPVAQDNDKIRHVFLLDSGTPGQGQVTKSIYILNNVANNTLIWWASTRLHLGVTE